jgi:hypothetical protein
MYLSKEGNEALPQVLRLGLWRDTTALKENALPHELDS